MPDHTGRVDGSTLQGWQWRHKIDVCTDVRCYPSKVRQVVSRTIVPIQVVAAVRVLSIAAQVACGSRRGRKMVK